MKPSIIADELNISKRQVTATIKLLDDGATIPFIARYRKEATGGLDEIAILNIQRRYASLVALDKRKTTILTTISELGKLTPELKAKIENTHDATILEDIYQPYRPRRRTKAQIAIENGLKPLAAQIMAQNLDDVKRIARRYIKQPTISSVDEAISGASNIIAEWVSDDDKVRGLVRAKYQRNAVITSQCVKGRESDGVNFKDYFAYTSPLRLCTSHRLLALLRGEKEGILKIAISIDDTETIERLCRMFIRTSATDVTATIIRQAVRDAYKNLIKPTIETEILAKAKAKADDTAIDMFAENARQLLLAPPLGHKRILAIDPGFRTGCKLACLDQHGNLLHHDVIYPNQPINDCNGAAYKTCILIDRFAIEAIAIGNGTASRETEKFISSLRLPGKIPVFIVNESGASIYSASEIAREEFPDYDITVRGTVSIGRRLLDPLAELVKIDPKSIGVGQYQHDVSQPKLRDALTYTVESCVNAVGVNINTASPELLSYVAGIGPALSRNIIEYRRTNGSFRRLSDLRKVPRLGEKAFQQCAGFLRIVNGDEILDNTGIHPENYQLVHTMASDIGLTTAQLVNNRNRLHQIDLSAYVTKEVGMPTLTDIITELEKPGRDPRGQQDSDSDYDSRIKSINDLAPGMEVSGVVNNITAFGCFVDLGIHENGLIHISQISDRFVHDPHEVVSINQRITAHVLDVDTQRGRIALTLKATNQTH